MHQEYIIPHPNSNRKQSILLDVNHKCYLRFYSSHDNLIIKQLITWQVACHILYNCTHHRSWLQVDTCKEFIEMARPKEIRWLSIT